MKDLHVGLLVGLLAGLLALLIAVVVALALAGIQEHAFAEEHLFAFALLLGFFVAAALAARARETKRATTAAPLATDVLAPKPAPVLSQASFESLPKDNFFFPGSPVS